MHLWDRLAQAKKELDPVQSKYRIVFETPDDLDVPACILVPDPNFMAAALHGGILPPIEAYLHDQAIIETYVSEHGLEGGVDHGCGNRRTDPQ